MFSNLYDTDNRRHTNARAILRTWFRWAVHYKKNGRRRNEEISPFSYNETVLDLFKR